MKDKIFGFVGLAKRAGKLSDGTDACITNIRNGKARLVILAKDTSAATAKKVNDKCKYYGVKIITYGEMETLGNAVGREIAACVSVNDDGFAQAILKCMSDL